jgi:integrative and conjugative element protein (TIGR02256 family)
MAMTAGQELAMEQLREVSATAEAHGGVITLVKIDEPEKPGDSIWAEVSIACAGLERVPDGLPLEDREQVLIRIPPDFPYSYPAAWVMHDRFAGFPHVHWKHWLCLYQAPSIEWDPNDGMFGFIDRLDYWLRQGALGQLHQDGAPMHPPATYIADGPVRTVVPRVDAPEIGTAPWCGTAVLRTVSDQRVDLVGWLPLNDSETPRAVAASILLPEPFPYEFPTNVGDLIEALAERGISRERLLETLRWAVTCNGEDTPLYVVIGAPMRGVRGGPLKQHLTAWYVEPLWAWALQTAFDQYSKDEETRAFGEKLDDLIKRWASDSKVEWCVVREDRPEIVVRRDHVSPMTWFAGRTVDVWGCGALGGHVAEYATRAGAKKLILRDNKGVSPGVLVRQPFDDEDIGYWKAHQLADRLRRIRPDVEVVVSTKSLLDDPLGGPDWVKGAEVVIDAAASVPVSSLLERRRWTWTGRQVPIISMVVGHTAERGMLLVARPGHSGGPHDLNRRMKLEACKRPDLTNFLNEFWPTERPPFFQPEPGCSDATFIGSAADVAGLAAMMLNWAAADLRNPLDNATATGHFVMQPHVANPTGQAAGANFAWNSDRVSHDERTGYEIRISAEAWAGIRSWIADGRKRFGRAAETGGLLFGERDEASGVIWVNEVSGPPRDSEHSPEKFVCGIEGTAELNAEKRTRTRRSVQYLGMWHTHPNSLPVPSATDWDGMRRLVGAAGGASRSLMLIVGGPHGKTPVLGTYVFRAADFSIPPGSVVILPCVMHIMDWG